jgi:HK97 gp10 family phage protein
LSVTLQLEGSDDLLRALQKLGKDAEAETRKAVQATAIEVRGDIVKRYQRGPASGRVYTRGSVTHQASAAGEAPATDTGRLASGTQYRMTGPLTAEVDNAVEYGPFLEFGTQSIAPRPAWRPAIQEAQPKFRLRLETALARVMI